MTYALRNLGNSESASDSQMNILDKRKIQRIDVLRALLCPG